ncbi:MAG: Rpn family recombination-promoting nuclease/putative transposase [Clostridia bacterium]|nr:Rpn family recombination-promoting nuclease/putative transposase [Clostridia bacterium]
MTKNKEQKNTQQKKRYNLKNDIVFKAFFSRKGNEEFLIDFLNALLDIQITQISIREEVDLEKLDPTEKGGRLDLQAKLNDGLIVNIELQIENQHNIEERTTFYSSKVISMETERGTEYKDINQVIMINILDYELFGFDEYISKTAIVLDKHRDFEVLKGIKWYFIELPKFRNAHPDMNEKINQWLAFWDDYDKGVIEMAEKKNPTLKKARQEMTYLTGDEEIKRLAFLREKWEMDRISDINHAKREGLAEGLAKGEKTRTRRSQKRNSKKFDKTWN